MVHDTVMTGPLVSISHTYCSCATHETDGWKIPAPVKGGIVGTIWGKQMNFDSLNLEFDNLMGIVGKDF